MNNLIHKIVPGRERQRPSCGAYSLSVCYIICTHGVSMTTAYSFISWIPLGVSQPDPPAFHPTLSGVMVRSRQNK